MAMAIFFTLNGLGVVFLLYVLVNFWREGHPSERMRQKSTAEVLLRNKAEVVVITHPVSHSALGGLSVIPLRARNQEEACNSARKSGGRETIEMPSRRFSTR